MPRYIVALLGLATIACDPVIGVTGVVRDRAGQPLEGVAVTLTSRGRGPHSASTAKDGSFGVGMVGAKPENTKIVFEKKGYKPLEKALGKDRNPALTIVLESSDGAQ